MFVLAVVRINLWTLDLFSVELSGDGVFVLAAISKRSVYVAYAARIRMVRAAARH